MKGGFGEGLTESGSVGGPERIHQCPASGLARWACRAGRVPGPLSASRVVPSKTPAPLFDHLDSCIELEGESIARKRNPGSSCRSNFLLYQIFLSTKASRAATEIPLHQSDTSIVTLPPLKPHIRKENSHHRGPLQSCDSIQSYKRTESAVAPAHERGLSLLQSRPYKSCPIYLLSREPLSSQALHGHQRHRSHDGPSFYHAGGHRDAVLVRVPGYLGEETTTDLPDTPRSSPTEAGTMSAFSWKTPSRLSTTAPPRLCPLGSSSPMTSQSGWLKRQSARGHR